MAENREFMNGGTTMSRLSDEFMTESRTNLLLGFTLPVDKEILINNYLGVELNKYG
ncbi:hypothetical protein JCM14467A_14170 [Vulcanisaeta sp. JCM 14467]